MCELVSFLFVATAYLIDLYTWVVIAAVILSWLIAFNVINPYNQFVRSLWQAIQAVTEPVIRPIRRMMPDLGGIDISPVILLVGLYLFKLFLLTVVAPNLLRAMACSVRI